MSYFNDDALASHLKKDHFACNHCDKEHKHVYYDKYANLQTHYNESHYACKEPECLEQCFVSFKFAEGLEEHYVLYCSPDQSA